METIQEYVRYHHSALRSHLRYTYNVIVFPSVSAALDRPYSYVIVATKALPEISPTSKLLSPFLSPSYPHPQPTYVLLQNGIGIEHDLYNALSVLPSAKESAPRILSCAVWIGTNLLSDNVVQHSDFVSIVHALIGSRVLIVRL